MVELVALDPDAAQAVVADSSASFIDDLVASGAPRQAATSASEAAIGGLLPDGVASAGHCFRSVEQDGVAVGRVWFGPVPDSIGDWYLYDIEIPATERGRGVGRAAVAAVIAEVSDSGGRRLGLNVASRNDAAISLYQSAGFERTSESSGGDEMWLTLRAVG